MQSQMLFCHLHDLIVSSQQVCQHDNVSAAMLPGALQL